MSDLTRPPDRMPDVGKVILPSRAFFLSWRHQTVPARLAAIEDAQSHYASLPADAPRGLKDMATAAVIAESVQPLEDLAYLATAWDQPYQGVATYVRATTWKRFTATNFWQEVRKWDDGRLDVFAGFAGRDPETLKVAPLMDGLKSLGATVEARQRDAMLAARDATLKRLRRVLTTLGDDWKQFSPYYLAYKHGALVINRDDVIFVDDDVEEITVETPRHEPSLAVWTRAGRKQELQADFNLTADELVRYAAGGGRLAVDLIEAFIASRLANIDALEFSDAGDVIGLKSMQLPWTAWLRKEDLEQQFWDLLGTGPRLKWVAEGTEHRDAAGR